VGVWNSVSIYFLQLNVIFKVTWYITCCTLVLTMLREVSNCTPLSPWRHGAVCTFFPLLQEIRQTVLVLSRSTIPLLDVSWVSNCRMTQRVSPLKCGPAATCRFWWQQKITDECLVAAECSSTQLLSLVYRCFHYDTFPFYFVVTPYFLTGYRSLLFLPWTEFHAVFSSSVSRFPTHTS
jgi:hypothetical protein